MTDGEQGIAIVVEFVDWMVFGISRPLTWKPCRLGRRLCSLGSLALLDFETSIIGLICCPRGLLLKCFAQFFYLGHCGHWSRW